MTTVEVRGDHGFGFCGRQRVGDRGAELALTLLATPVVVSALKGWWWMGLVGVAGPVAGSVVGFGAFGFPEPSGSSRSRLSSRWSNKESASPSSEVSDCSSTALPGLRVPDRGGTETGEPSPPRSDPAGKVPVGSRIVFGRR